MLDVNTINGSLETDKTAGIESIAKITSEASINNNAIKKGVACKTLFFLTKK